MARRERPMQQRNNEISEAVLNGDTAVATALKHGLCSIYISEIVKTFCRESNPLLFDACGKLNKYYKEAPHYKDSDYSQPLLSTLRYYRDGFIGETIGTK